jgi:hypothetical protein
LNHQNLIFLLILFLCCNCATKKNKELIFQNITKTGNAKFEPANGECLFFIGQDLRATGGLDEYKDGYCDYFEVPAGITVYTNFSPGSTSFGHIQKGNDGIKNTANWGAEDNCAQCYIDSDKYKHSVIAIGLSMVDHEKQIASGNRDYLIRELGEWIKDNKRPVFLRIGYEFDGWEWNHYNKKHYLAAWKRIHTIFNEMQVDNVAFVWQSKGNGSNQTILEKWYPGDDLVDWCGYSYFNKPDQEMLVFARKHNKPVFIAEATPVLNDGVQFTDSQITKPETAIKVWENWFVPFITTLNNNKDVIKAFSYINVNWSVQPMWINNPVFQKVDSRIQKSDFISEKWMEEISKPRYLKPNPKLLNHLKNNQ